MTTLEHRAEQQVNPYDGEVIALFHADPMEREAAMLGRISRVATEYQPAATMVADMALDKLDRPDRMFEARSHLAVLDEMITVAAEQPR